MVTTTTSNPAAISGGTGGNGGTGSIGGGGGGGGGGEGGYGVAVDGTGLIFTNSGSVTGGTGGTGGNGGGGNGGNGGDGGQGVFLTNGNRLVNSGTITGGNGGIGGAGGGGGVGGTPGQGGAGIVGADLTIINSGTISGGLSGDGVTRANSITFTGGTNLLNALAGSSLIGNLTIPAGSTITGTGVSTITGNYTQAAGSIYQVNVTPAGASTQLAITGTATIGGTINVLGGPGIYTTGQTYTILSATGGVAGTYGGVTDNLLLFDFQDIYLADQVQLVVVAANPQNLAGLTFNQRSTATGLIQSGLLLPVQTPAELDQFSGEIHGTAASVAFEKHQLFLQSVAQRLRTASFNPYGLCNDESVVDTWIMPFGLYGNVDGNGNAHGFDYNITGFAIGFDRCIAPGTLAGLSLGYAGWDLTNDLDSHAEVQAFLLDLHGVQQLGRGYLLGSIAYEHDDYETSRPIPFLGRLAQAGYGGDQLGTYVEAGYSFDLGVPRASATGGLTLQPLAGFQYMSLWREGFAESGAGAVDLLVDEEQTSSCRSFLGGRALLPFTAPGGGLCAPEARALWVHEYVGDQRETTNHFEGAPAVAFPIRGVNLGDDFGIVGVGFNCYTRNWLTLGLYYDFYFTSEETAHSGSGQLRVLW